MWLRRREGERERGREGERERGREGERERGEGGDVAARGWLYMRASSPKESPCV